jgi:predicted nucleotidyltransferase
MEVLGDMVRAMLQELQTVELRQQRDRSDMDIRVSGLQEQTLKRWLALQKDMEALYVLTQKGD